MSLTALDRRDVEGYLEVVSPQIELITFVSPLQGQGPITGHEGIRDYFHELWSFSEASAIQVEEIRAVEERVLAFFVIKATAGQGIETTVRAAGVYDRTWEDPPRPYLRRPHRSPRSRGAVGVPIDTARSE